MRKIIYLSILLLLVNAAVAHTSPAKNIAARHCFLIAPLTNDSTLILIPFEYKQSALFHAFTFEVIDSVVNLLLKDTAITLSIDGYAHIDEGSDTICKYLSLNRALFVRDYVLGRGIAASRLLDVRGMGKVKSKNSDINKNGHKLNCKVELHLNYPPPPKPVVIADRDEDGVADATDACPDEFGYQENNGCPDKDAVIIPFEREQSWLSPITFKALDSVITVLKENPSYAITIQGHAYKLEGINSVCEKLGSERATNVKNYLLSRNISNSRIIKVVNYSNARPLNTGKDPMQIALNSRAEILFTKYIQ